MKIANSDLNFLHWIKMWLSPPLLPPISLFPPFLSVGASNIAIQKCCKLICILYTFHFSLLRTVAQKKCWLKPLSVLSVTLQQETMHKISKCTLQITLLHQRGLWHFLSLFSSYQLFAIAAVKSSKFYF